MKSVPVLLLTLCLAACASSPPLVDIQAQASPEGRFSTYKTYSWLTQPEGASPEGSRYIVDAIDAQLRQRGWQKTEDGDIAVRVQVSTADKQTIENVYSTGSGGRGPLAGLGTMTTRAVAYREGTMVVDLFDTAAKRAVWRGTASGALPSSREQVKNTIDTVVGDMFAKLPTMP